MTQRITSLSAFVVEFCRFLRTRSYSTGPEEEMLILKALKDIDLGNQDNFMCLIKTICCRNEPEWNAFEEHFLFFWNEYSKAVDSKTREALESSSGKKNSPSVYRSLQSLMAEKKDGAIEETSSYSRSRRLSEKEFSEINDEEIDELARILKAISRRLARNLRRRYEKSRLKLNPDAGKTFRKNLKYGGEILKIFYRKPSQMRSRIIVVCDVSRSMQLFSSFLLQFIFAFQGLFRRVTVYSFGTELQNLDLRIYGTKKLFNRESLASIQQSWYGGTRIGECFQALLEKEGNRINHQTTMIILSDGWDQGDVQLIQNSMLEFKKKSRKIIWLNPLAGFPGYKPETAGMQAALPYVDCFLPAHNARSLKKLIQLI